MEQNLHSTSEYDYRQYDRVWQRVAPDLDPYPGFRTPEQAAGQGDPAAQQAPSPAVMSRQEEQLPGAVPDPCCMGSAAAEILEVLTGFAEEELEDRRHLLALARQAPSWARQQLRDMAREEGNHAQRLMAAYYLITGTCYRPNVICGQVSPGRWCPALRERYHDEACGGLNYARAAEGTTDPCLTRLLNELSDDEYRHAEELMRMLERSLRG